MADILSTVTDAEARVVHSIRSMQRPVVGYLRRGVKMADDRLPDVTYPSSLPKPGELLDTQFDFAKALLDAQHDMARAMVEAVAPLAGAESRAKSRSTRTAKASAV